MIISLFGPDGVGKSTISRMLQNDDWFVFSGTGVSSWPATTWRDELNAAGIHEPSYESDDHFIEKIRRSHELAHKLERQYDRVVIDSDPFHKTLMHAYMNGIDRFDELYKVAYPAGSDKNDVHVLIYLEGNDDDVSKELQRRIHKRGAEHFDPKSVQDSQRMIRACEIIFETLVKNQQNVYRLDASDTDAYQKFLGAV